MSISVVATGLVAEGPSQLLGEAARAVFVLDPFPRSTGSRLAHACEVVCHRQDLAAWVLEQLNPDDRVEVTGQLVMDSVDVPSRTISVRSA